jgi:hypothetical protein
MLDLAALRDVLRDFGDLQSDATALAVLRVSARLHGELEVIEADVRWRMHGSPGWEFRPGVRCCRAHVAAFDVG